MNAVVTVALCACTLLTTIAPGRAESWCAEPLIVHEWGVHVFDTGGAAVPDPELRFFHTPTNTRAAGPQAPVRTLPADNGMRKLPVLHFYSDRGGDIPVAIEVGFADGSATHWWPDVDRFDPNAARELEWQRLDLSRAPKGKTGAMPPWADAARAIPDALWVNRGPLSERFVFYEGGTTEHMPLVLERGPEWKRGHRHYLLKNDGAFPVYDVMFMHHEGGKTYLLIALVIPAGASTDFVLEALPTTAVLPDVLRHMIVADGPIAVTGECVMGRDPAKPFESSSSNRVFPREFDLILSVWSQRFFGATPTTKVLYREDNAYLKRQIPLSLYTDMYNYIVLSRTSLALWEGVVLP